MILRKVVAIAATVVLAVGLLAQPLGGTEDHVWSMAVPRLVYIFSAENEQQVTRARALPSWVAGWDATVHIVGLLRTGSGATPNGGGVPETLEGQLSYPVVAFEQVHRRDLPSTLVAQSSADTDLAVLLTARNEVVWSATGAQLQMLLGGEQVATDIDRSTWGKIKELFQ